MRYAAVVILAVSLAGTISLEPALSAQESGRREAPKGKDAPAGLPAEEAAVLRLFRESSVSVVHVGPAGGQMKADLAAFPEGAGSGIVWDDQGHIVTAHHIVARASDLRVTLPDLSTWKAVPVGSSAAHDLAVLRIDAPRGRLKPVPVGTSHDLQVGQKVFALGNPFGLDQTLSAGIVSGLGRQGPTAGRHKLRGLIQTDAAINAGNAGGPLLDSAGRLVGVNTVVADPAGTWRGTGFAVAVDEVNRVVPLLIRHGKVLRPHLGVEVGADDLARRLGVEGVLIVGVQEKGPAARAGLRPTRRDPDHGVVLGDVIVAVNGKKVKSSADLFDLLGDRRVGDKVTVTVLRDEERKEIEVTLDAEE
jgi:S1-C subfamily serine protease